MDLNSVESFGIDRAYSYILPKDELDPHLSSGTLYLFFDVLYIVLVDFTKEL